LGVEAAQFPEMFPVMKENVQNNIIAEEKTSRAIKSVSRAANDNYGETLLSASYNNKQQ
jgi:hypothetical protein